MANFRVGDTVELIQTGWGHFRGDIGVIKETTALMMNLVLVEGRQSESAVKPYVGWSDDSLVLIKTLNEWDQ